jgi:hypothetical protein
VGERRPARRGLRITYSDAMLILQVSRSRISAYVKRGDLTTNGETGKKTRVSAQSVALHKLRLERKRAQGTHLAAAAVAREAQGPDMATNPSRPSADTLRERASQGRHGDPGTDGPARRYPSISSSRACSVRMLATASPTRDS